MNRVGDPLRTDLDESKFGLGKLVGDLMEDQSMERAHHRELEFGKPAFVEEKIMHREATRRRVHADRQIQPTGFFIQRKKMRAAQTLVTFQTPNQSPAGAVLFSEARLFQAFTHR